MKNKTFIIAITLFAVFSMSIFICLNRDKNILKEEIINDVPKESIAVYIKQENGNYEKNNSIPNKDAGYQLNETKSICDGTASISWNKNEWGLELANIDKDNIKCYLYFDKITVKDIILANKTISERPNFNMLTIDPGNTIYSLPDDDGTSYYYAGAAKNNYVKFAGFYWRIIRINGDNTIRLIYQGTSVTSTGTDTQISTSAFNSSYNDNMYVGYKYASGNVHGTSTNSTIKGVLDSWYTSNLVSYASKIDTNAGFCNDRESSTANTSSNGSGGIGTTTTYYGGYIRFVPGGSWSSNPTPTFKCKNINTDYFTVSGASKGNKALQYPIGLLTADEAVAAGTNWNEGNSSFYLYTGQNYWTMSPYSFSGTNAWVFIVIVSGNLNAYTVGNTIGVRPVINLRSDTTFSSGDGTALNPYIVD